VGRQLLPARTGIITGRWLPFSLVRLHETQERPRELTENQDDA